MIKIITIIGARPQFIKHAALDIALKKRFLTKTIHTGQHYDGAMSDIFFNQLKINKPDYQLSIKSKLHGAQTAFMMIDIEQIILAEKPDFILVYGDTNSTLAGAIVASKTQIPLIHVEAGLRSYNRTMPEEVNRVITDSLSTLLFCSSAQGISNLSKEGITQNVFECGDVMKDVLKVMDPYLLNPKPQEDFIYATLHRPYNVDMPTRLMQILNVLNNIESKIMFPIHPRTKSNMEAFGIDKDEFKNIVFVEPMGYVESLAHQKYSELVITDSGGIQKEAYWLKKKCITIRSETEWVETLNGNWNCLVHDPLEEIYKMRKVIPEDYNDNLYGDGNASSFIAELIFNFRK